MPTERRPTRQILVALLRGVNVGGRNALPMANLRALAEQLGFSPVSTYLQSGNLVFGAPNGPSAPVVSALETAIGNALGREVRVLLRSADELAELVAGNPFTLEQADSPGLHVTFLSDAPDPRRVLALPTATGGDDYRVSTREIVPAVPNRVRTDHLEQRILGEMAGRRGHDSKLEDGHRPRAARRRGKLGLTRSALARNEPSPREPIECRQLSAIRRARRVSLSGLPEPSQGITSSSTM